MKKILLLGSVVVSTLLSAQTDFKKTAIELEYGINKPVRRQGNANVVNYVHAGLGVRYNVTNIFGYRLGLAFDQFNDDGTTAVAFTNNFINLKVEGTVALGTICNISQWTNRVNFMLHAGPGMSFLMRSTDAVTPNARLDKQVSINFGLSTMFKIIPNLSAWIDAGFTSGIQGQWTYSMDEWTEDKAALRGLDKTHVNLALGFSYYLGDQAEHADWTPNQVGNPAELEALKAKIAKAEKDMMDDDKDGVPNYIDQEPGTAEGANVNTKGVTVIEKKVVDIDGDGVLDVNDFCPTIKGVASANGCPDKDGDGVYDFVDKCPNAAGLAADNGCPVVKEAVKNLMTKAMKGVQFDSGKASIIKKSLPILDEMAKVMLANPSYNLSIEGHTDNVGVPANNLKLSDDRAKAVRAYLVGKGVAEGRMKAQGFGDTQPKASNKTKKGQAENRRVEFKVSFQE
ncbi:MAG: OmpA family protein [Flavobacteriia bacterium]|nr:OmpA family protein [Flavobacteriia bacterium]